jgi:hypothetical protein
MILVDARFSQSVCPDADRNVGGLSKWVRPRVRDFNSQRDAMAQLAHFFRELDVDPTMVRAWALARRVTLGDAESDAWWRCE